MRYEILSESLAEVSTARSCSEEAAVSKIRKAREQSSLRVYERFS